MFKKFIIISDKDVVSYFDYIVRYAIPVGISGLRYSFIWWIKLIQGDYSDYKILNSRKQLYTDEELFEQLREEFWYSLGDDIMDKDNYDELCRRVKEVEEGKVKLIPLTENFFDDVKDLLDL